MSIYQKIIYFIERKIIPGFKIRKNELVIDIGSGDKPFWRADVFLDNLQLGNYQRITGSNIVDSIGFFVNGDILKTNFKDKAFDFSYCSHVLEHVSDPVKAIREITRISKRGYIEVPNGLLDLITPNQGHLWLVFYQNNKLIFIRKSQVFDRILGNNGRDFSYLIGKVKKPFISFYWSNSINYEIFSKEEMLINFLTKNKKEYKKIQNLSVRFHMSIVKILRKLFCREKIDYISRKVFRN